MKRCLNGLSPLGTMRFQFPPIIELPPVFSMDSKSGCFRIEIDEFSRFRNFLLLVGKFAIREKEEN